MFRSFSSRDRAGKSVKTSKTKKSYSESQKRKLAQKLDGPQIGSPLTSPIITLVVGREGRLFAAHEDQLTRSPFFAAALKGQFFESDVKKVVLPDEEPEILSCVLEYLYKGDYTPRLLYNKRRNSWELEGDSVSKQDSYSTGRAGGVKSTIYLAGVGGEVLRDTVVYCTAEKFGLDELKRLALRKQGLQTGVHVEVILRSARYAYDNTPESDSHLRAHYLALIIRCRKLFKRSGRMEREMEIGGSKLFFDLFVSMCRHIDDIVEMTNKSSPKTI